jgi:hypothetical protein
MKHLLACVCVSLLALPASAESLAGLDDTPKNLAVAGTMDAPRFVALDAADRVVLLDALGQVTRAWNVAESLRVVRLGGDAIWLLAMDGTVWRLPIDAVAPVRAPFPAGVAFTALEASLSGRWVVAANSRETWQLEVATGRVSRAAAVGGLMAVNDAGWIVADPHAPVAWAPDGTPHRLHNAAPNDDALTLWRENQMHRLGRERAPMPTFDVLVDGPWLWLGDGETTRLWRLADVAQPVAVAVAHGLHGCVALAGQLACPGQTADPQLSALVWTAAAAKDGFVPHASMPLPAALRLNLTGGKLMVVNAAGVPQPVGPPHADAVAVAMARGEVAGHFLGGAVTVFDFTTGQVKTQLPPLPQPLLALGPTADGWRALDEHGQSWRFAGRDWQAEGRRLSHVWDHEAQADGAGIALANDDGIAVWTAAEGLRWLSHIGSRSLSEFVGKLVISQRGTHLSGMQIDDTAGSHHVVSSPTCASPVAFSPNADRLAVARWDGQLCVYALTPDLPHTCTEGTAEALSWDEAGTLLLQRRFEGLVVCDGRTLAQRAVFKPWWMFGRWVHHWSGRFFVDRGGLFDLQSGGRVPDRLAPADLRRYLDPAASESHPADDAEEGALRPSMPAQRSKSPSAFWPNGDPVLASQTDLYARMSHAGLLREVERLQIAGNVVLVVTVGERDHYGREREVVRLLRTADLKPAMDVELGKQALLDRDGRYLVTTAGTPGLWDLRTGKRLLDWSGGLCGVESLSAVNHGRAILTQTGNARTIRRWPELTPVLELSQGAETASLSANPQSRWFRGSRSAIVGPEGLLDVEGGSFVTPEWLQKLPEGAALVSSPDGARAFTWTWSGRAVVAWGVDWPLHTATWALVAPFQNRLPDVELLAVADDGQRVLLRGVAVWPVGQLAILDVTSGQAKAVVTAGMQRASGHAKEEAARLNVNGLHCAGWHSAAERVVCQRDEQVRQDFSVLDLRSGAVMLRCPREQTTQGRDAAGAPIWLACTPPGGGVALVDLTRPTPVKRLGVATGG